ncbi:MAG: YtxH domain-containing protein [Chitinophagaceae bacterium]|nr:YtxH domain-containing protein [Chitinophagaceae bacterium]
MSFKFTLSVLLGAAIGGVIAHYLHTSEGQDFVNRVKEDANDLSKSLTGRKEPADNQRESFSSLNEGQPETVDTIVVVGLDA